MTARTHRFRLDTVLALRRLERFRTFGTLALVMLGPLLTVLTFLSMGPLAQGVTSGVLRGLFLLDIVYVIIVAGLIFQRVARMVAARRSKSAGSRLHLRLTGVFTLMSLLPTVSVAIFATLSLNMGLEAWFSDRVGRVVSASVSAAQAYEEEHRRDLIIDARALARLIETTKRARVFMDDGDIRQVLSRGQREIQRGLREAYVIDGTGEIRSRGERSYLFDYEKPTALQIQEAFDQGIVVIQDWDNNEFRVLLPIESIPDRLLYVSRNVDGSILNLLDDTQETAEFYQQQERERGRVLFEFALIYLGFALILILAAVWLALWFAERLSQPVGRLASAAQRVGDGDLDTQVVEDSNDDEIGLLGQYFNRMTRQLKAQREELLSNTRHIETRRRLFDSVLGSVSSGVLGLDTDTRITFINRSAERLLDPQGALNQQLIHEAVPEFSELLERLFSTNASFVQGEVKVMRRGQLEHLLVRISTRVNEDNKREGYVVAFDDVTDLVTAQRAAAWSDVARRIAHEIKNPLTPIQLSAERIKRKFSRQLDEENATSLAQLTEVVVRQTNDLRRIVDEFSKFARMPEPEASVQDLGELLRQAILLQETGQPDVTFELDLSGQDMIANIDSTMITQALTNLMKNAGEAIETRMQQRVHEGFTPKICVSSYIDDGYAVISIADNGIGLPQDRARLFEPYVTTRDKGTGLGLPIVKKIIEEHGGTLSLDNAPAFEGSGGLEDTHVGAMAVIRLPLVETLSNDNVDVSATPDEQNKKRRG